MRSPDARPRTRSEGHVTGEHEVASGRRRRNWLILANLAGWTMVILAVRVIFF
jgi:hypothetical protein